MYGLVFLLLGPAPFLESAFPWLGTVNAQWALKIFSLVVFGVAGAVALIPSYPDMHHGMHGENISTVCCLDDTGFTRYKTRCRLRLRAMDLTEKG